MDKQREEFEAWAYRNNWNTFRVRDMGLDRYVYDFVNGAWEGWQQAKKSAVPYGGVNLNKFDLLRKMHNIRDLNNGDYYSDEIEENICAVEAMIEAQEPTND